MRQRTAVRALGLFRAAVNQNLSRLSKQRSAGYVEGVDERLVRHLLLDDRFDDPSQPRGHVTRQRDGTTLKIRTPFPLLEAPVRGCERAFSRVVMRARRLSEFDKRWKKRSSLPLWVAGALSCALFICLSSATRMTVAEAHFAIAGAED